ncbi:MurR/RpiR family transcriptional regulator [Varunaivibrio sulfuroxidans]|uniref:RpiR family transcriptional regulator n=1 Tax=Varunaivibrio sulfuroxidans TaxID=1773489 RepID=A0A4R3J9V1_9PROT|nr:MurR/RpiR family transcriptional regulator [Varunaivibrio sulfuroxidans]TCS62185.1 RpiR family transcriptional regulator [Varunaivibrio sulfuroxidans]WES30612.1 MurR/RpiR family transcriptional regulator [Varunaivibrio sulfuroxidans]
MDGDTRGSETLAEKIARRTERFTRLEKVLANYLSVRPDSLLIGTGASLAAQAGVSPMTVSRFIQKLGFKNLAEAKRALRREAHGPTVSRFSRRYEMFRETAGKTFDGQANYELQCTAIKKAYTLRTEPMWKRVIDMVAHGRHLFTAGFQTTSHLADGLAMHLEYVRPNVQHLDGVNGTYANVLGANVPDAGIPGGDAVKNTLIIIDIFRYGRNGPELARVARDAGADVIVVCDEFCDWAAGITPYVLPVATNIGLFFSSTVAIQVLLNLLIHDVVDTLGEAAARRMESLSEAQNRFGQYLK